MLLAGLGWGMVAVSGFVTIYYNIIITWVLFYLFKSFTKDLPWRTCGNSWNSDACLEKFAGVQTTVRTVKSPPCRKHATNSLIISPPTRYCDSQQFPARAASSRSGARCRGRFLFNISFKQRVSLRVGVRGSLACQRMTHSPLKLVTH